MSLIGTQCITIHSADYLLQATNEHRYAYVVLNLCIRHDVCIDIKSLVSVIGTKCKLTRRVGCLSPLFYEYYHFLFSHIYVFVWISKFFCLDLSTSLYIFLNVTHINIFSGPKQLNHVSISLKVIFSFECFRNARQ